MALHLSDHDVTDINANDILLYVNEVNAASAFIFCDVSIMVSIAISMDRLLALLLGLRYKHVVTLLRRARTIVICVWLIAILVTLMGSSWSYRFSIIIASVLVMLSLVISIFSYTKILHQAQVQVLGQQGQPNEQTNSLNIANYKTTVSSIAWVQLALVVCYVPFGVVAEMRNVSGSSWNRQTVWFFVPTLLYLNSSLNIKSGSLLLEDN